MIIKIKFNIIESMVKFHVMRIRNYWPNLISVADEKIDIVHIFAIGGMQDPRNHEGFNPSSEVPIPFEKVSLVWSASARNSDGTGPLSPCMKGTHK